MKKIAIYGQSYSLTAEKEVQILLKVLEEQQVVIFFEKQFYTLLNQHNVLAKKYSTFEHFNDLNSSFNLMFTIGGDGTILRAITYIRDLNIPILGINIGRMGFLASIKKDTIQESIACVVNGDYTIQERSLLSIRTEPEIQALKELNFALNEITIARKNTTSMIGVQTHLNKEYLNNYWADGLIARRMKGRTGRDRIFGGQLDLLIDIVSYGVTPAILLLSFGEFAPLLLPIAFIVLAAALLVLAEDY